MFHIRYAVPALLAAGALAPASFAAEPCHVDTIEGPQGWTPHALQDDVLATATIEIEDTDCCILIDGTVTIYRRSGGRWTVEAVIESVNQESNNVFGNRQAIDGDVLAISDVQFPVDQPSSGAVFIYRHDDEEWFHEATLTAPETNPFPWNSMFGAGLAIDDDVVLAGAPGHHVEGVFQAGAVFVFRNGSDGWELETMLSAPELAESARFGWSVALAGDLALIGAHGVDGPAQNSGRAFAFRFDGTDWVFEQEFIAPDAAGTQWFGWAVALDAAGEIAVVGAPQDGSQIGAVYVFRHDGEAWTFEQKLTAADPVGTWTFFGKKAPIDADGVVIIAGAPDDSAEGFEAGAAHLFRYDGEQWEEIVKITSPAPQNLAHFGGASIWQDEAKIKQGGSQGGKAFFYRGIQGRDCLGTGQPDACDIFDGLAEDSTGSGIPDECEFAGDLNGDGVVDVDDLLILLSLWGDCEDDPNTDPDSPPDSPAGCFGDISHDGQIGIDDLLILLANWG